MCCFRRVDVEAVLKIPRIEAILQNAAVFLALESPETRAELWQKTKTVPAQNTGHRSV